MIADWEKRFKELKESSERQLREMEAVKDLEISELKKAYEQKIRDLEELLRKERENL